MSELAITVGEGVKQPQGKQLRLDRPSALISALRAQPQSVERWWSPFTWERDHRQAVNWRSASGVAVDVDYHTKDPAPDDQMARLAALARSGALPGSVFHLTPHGCRVVFMFADACTDRDAAIAASVGAAALVGTAIAALPFQVDPGPMEDLARLFFTPNAIAKGVARHADVVELRAAPYSPAELAAAAPKPAPAPTERGDRSATPAARRSIAGSIDEARRRWIADHRTVWPKSGGDCPICHHRGCFGQLPENPAKWFCFSTQHAAGGARTERGWVGDELDVEMADRGLDQVELLRDDGYLTLARSAKRLRPPSPAGADPASFDGNAAIDAEADLAPVIDLDSRRAQKRPFHNNSFLTALQIITDNARDVLKGRCLELNEMTDQPEFARQQLLDSDVDRVRAEVERNFPGSIDSQGNAKGLRLSRDDVFRAMVLVAKERPYHPVREYLESLGWDGVPRLNAVAEEILGAQRTPLNEAIARRFFVAAVARPLRPGCKVDTVLVLIGPQGGGKSSFLRTLASPEWFNDSPVDVGSKDAMQTLRGAWIHEWAELDVLRRARDAAMVKAFLSSAADIYRPSYGRLPVRVQRSSIFVGTTNDLHFLTDDTGNRRFWPLRVGQVELGALAAQRDQLWAEAVAALRAGEPWWLTAEEEAELGAVHEQHQVRDAWEEPVAAWAEARLVEFVTAEVLEHALQKPRGQWSQGDTRRVAAVLRRLGYVQAVNKPAGKSRPWSKGAPR